MKQADSKINDPAQEKPYFPSK